MSASQNLWVVLTVDIVGSQKIEGLRQTRDQILKPLSERHLDQGRVLSRYTVTAWDEFQNVLTHPWDLPDVVWDLRLAFRPQLQLKIGAGLGRIDQVPGPETPINEESSGEAFLRAREAIEHLSLKYKYRLLTLVRSGDPDLDRTLNLIYMLLDSLLSNLSDRQWETACAYETTKRLAAAAQCLSVKDESTVSRNLQRGFYWQLLDARQEIREVIKSSLHSEVQED